MESQKTKSVYETLASVNISHHIEKKNGLSYISWANAWHEIMVRYPLSKYQVKEYNGKPYLYEKNLGYMICTKIDIEGITHSMHLPVMDGANKAQKDESYTYEVAEWVNRQKTGKYIQKTVEAATMFDINTAIMRCLVKNIALFGLGLNLYNGDDLPILKEVETVENNAILKAWSISVDKCQTTEELNLLYEKNKDIISKNLKIKELLSSKKKEIANENVK
jgi:hypothetical protein